MAQSLKLFATHGVDAVSLRDIGTAAGFTNPALFRHFASKEALAASLFETCYRRLVAALHEARQTAGFAGWLAAALTEVAAEPEAVLYVMDNLRRYFATLPDELRADNLPALARAMIDREQAAGRFRRDLDVSLAIAVLLGTLGQIARVAHFDGVEIDAAAQAHRLADLLGRGFGTLEGRQ